MKKPEQILELERVLGIELEETTNPAGILHYQQKKTYLINDKREIIGLNLRDCGLKEASFLANLTNLISLNLNNNDISDINVLENIPSLKHLILSNNKISSFAVFNKLPLLEYLNISGNPEIDLSEIINLSNLNTLIALEIFIKNEAELGKFSALTNLSISLERGTIENVSFLEKLANIKKVSFWHGTINNIHVTNLSELTKLSFYEVNSQIIKLENLPLLEKFDISEQMGFSTFSAINLASLQKLDLTQNLMAEYSFVNLSMLEVLMLNENKISTFNADSANLPRLKSLYLKGNHIEQIENIEFPFLETLDVSYNFISEINFNLLKSNLPSLKKLYLHNNNITQIPKELYDDNQENNCFQNLSSYFEDIDTYGWDENNELKIVIIGNGGVGKSSLVSRLVENKFNKEYDSTHSIQLKQYELKVLEQDKQKTYNINIWDFGGQDIYHATHRLFMQTRALFVLAWDWETETNLDKKQKIGDYEYQNHDLEYWLNYVKVLGKGSKVMVVQTKTNNVGIKNVENINQLREKYKDIWFDDFWIDSKESNWSKNGFSKLKLVIINAILSSDLLRKEILPLNWIAQRKGILSLRKQKKPLIPQSAFRAEMVKHNKKAFLSKFGMREYKQYFKNHEITENPLSFDIILSWLSDSGALFYNHNLFENKIIINQQWAIDAVYTLFDRKTNYPKLKNKTWEFTESEIFAYWVKDQEGNLYSDNDRNLFLSFMDSCEICYFSNEKYVFPALMLDEKSKLVASAWINREDISLFARYDMRFFHYGTLQSFLVRLHGFQKLEILEIWQYGAYIQYNKTIALIEADLEKKTILVRASGEEDKSLLDKIRNQLFLNSLPSDIIELMQDKNYINYFFNGIESYENISVSFSLDGNIFFTEKDKDKDEPMRNFFGLDKNNNFEKTVIKKLNELNEGQENMHEGIKEINKTTKSTEEIAFETFDAFGKLDESFKNFLLDFSKYQTENTEKLNELLDELYQRNKTDIDTEYTEKLKNGTFTFSKGEFKGITIPFKADKLEKNSLEMLACGVYMYEKIGHTNQDKAPINVEFCRIIETEFSAKIFNGFKNYLIDNLIKRNTKNKFKLDFNNYKKLFEKSAQESHIVSEFAKNVKMNDDLIKSFSNNVHKNEKDVSDSWNEKKHSNQAFTFEKIAYGLDLLTDSNVQNIDIVKKFKLFIDCKFEWSKISDFNLKSELIKKDDSLFQNIFGDKTKNPKYNLILFGDIKNNPKKKDNLRSIYRNPSGHTGTFTIDENKNYKTEYCIDIVLAFLKVWTAAIKEN